MNGCVVSLKRGNTCRIAVWNKDASNVEATRQLGFAICISYDLVDLMVLLVAN